MVAGYRLSSLDKNVLRQMETIDRSARDFFTIAPFVVDCRNDSEGFRLNFTEQQRTFIIDEYAKGRLSVVSQLARPANAYAVEKLRDCRAALTSDTMLKIRRYLENWKNERARKISQMSKSDHPNGSIGIDIIMPISGIRLGYDHAAIIGL